MTSTDPIEIKETSPQELRITWADQHVSIYLYTNLRACCPCALCRSTREKGGIEATLSEMVRPDIAPRDIQTVGRYALSFSWSDGHETGIYTFDMLRELCPCDVCVDGPS